MKLICSSIIGLLVLFGVAFSFDNPTLAKEKDNNEKVESAKRNFDSDERKIFDLVNRERRKYDLDELEWNSDLADLARSYSKKMARERFFSHYERNGNSVADRAKAMKISRWKSIGENLFMSEGYEKFTQLAVRGWMRSSGHRQNILDGRFNETGIGIAKAKDGTIYITQVFLQY